MLATISLLVLSISESFDYYFQQKLTHHEVRLWLAAISYTSRIGCMGFTAAITQRINSKHVQCIYLGILLNGIIAFLSIPTGCIFGINEAHQWSRGILYVSPYIFVVWYASVLIFSGFKNFRTNRKESLLILAGTAVCVLGNAIELIYQWKMILSCSFITYICFYFLCLNVDLYRHDGMTTLFNRRSFFMDAKRWGDKPMIIVSMDLNDLKLYNDIQGHAAGDRVLCAVAEIMKSSFKTAGWAYRIGGDEFMGIFPDKTMEETQKYLDDFQQRLSKTKYKVACGCALFNPGDIIESVMEVADQKMYEHKRLMKGKDGVIR